MSKKAILVKRNYPKDLKHQVQLKEFIELAESAGYEVVDIVVQTREMDRRYQIGSGKIHFLAEIVQSTKADKLIFYNKLSVIQLYNISKVCGVDVIDKFHLILEIFAQRASTKIAQLQVELAKLEYELPKAKARVSLAKKEEHPGFMSVGGYEESQLQDIKRRISKIREDLKVIGKKENAMRSRRREHGIALIALAGYTNAGKSTLLNALTNENIQVDNKLFTTLSPTTRAINIKGRKALLTDTVGFIEDLPYWMVDAFRSTLDEIFLADVILLVVDASDSLEEIQRKLKTCYDTLWGKIKSTPIITVFNKIDLISKEKRKEIKKVIKSQNSVFVSAKKSSGFEEFKEVIYKNLPIWKRAKIKLPLAKESMSVLSWLYEDADLIKVTYNSEINVEFEAREEVVNKVCNEYVE
ncbi:MAG TPA: GTPase HflX [Methanosarcinales archaeon]|nr:GTPase HflX [Methanosarcinales archaeon]